MKGAIGANPIISAFFLGMIWVTGLSSAAGGASNAPAQADLFTAQPAMREVKLTGYTRARHIMDIVSEEAGRCVKVNADIGDTIGKNGVFAVLDRTYINLSLEKNRADQKRVNADIAYNAKEVDRYEKLVRRNTAAQARLDELQNRLDRSRFALKALMVEEDTLRERRKRHVIHVPPGWKIIDRSVEPGEWVAVGRQLGKAGDYRVLLVPFSLSTEEYNALTRLPTPPALLFPEEGEKGATVRGDIARISPAFDPNTRKITVDLSVQGGLSTLRGGLRSELVLRIPDASGAVVVPTPAVAERYEAFWLTREDGAQVRVVLLGSGPEDLSIVRSPDVRPGDRFKVTAEK